ncbi:hypothetical protein MTO96_004730 [Rhipicephalus appendiculatus]
MSPGTKDREAERKRQQRVAASPDTKATEAERKRQQRMAASPETKAREAERKRQQRAAASSDTKASEAERKRQQRVAASPVTKAREVERNRQQWLSPQPGLSTNYSNTPRLGYAEYMANYNPTKNTKRNRSAILKWHSYPESDVLNFKREHVLLFHPFRKEVGILDCNKFNDIFDTNSQAIMQVKKTFTHNVDINYLVTMCDSIIAEDREMRAQVHTHQEEQMRQLQDSETIVKMVDCVDDSDIRLGAEVQ